MQSQLQAATEPDALAACHILLNQELAKLNSRIRELLQAEVKLVDEIGRYALNGGKRLRPLLLLLGTRMFQYQGLRQIDLAVVIEFIHTATLLHDDVVDHSELRHGRLTAHRRWSPEASVLTGDFLYSRAFQVMVSCDDIRIMRLMADTTNSIAEGELRQLIHRRDPELQEQEYFRVIHSKTARLFAAAARLAAILCGRNEEEEQTLGDFGKHFGTAYQLVDDVLDYLARPGTLGKNLGEDLAEGKATLPLLHALWNSPRQAREHLQSCIRGNSQPEAGEILRIMENSGSIQYTMQCATRETETAERHLGKLPDGVARKSMAALSRWNLERCN